MLGLHQWAGFSLIAASRGLLSRCSMWASHCGGVSGCGAWALEHRLRSHGTSA